MKDGARFVVGIDLGTSNSALAYADLEEVKAEGRPLIRELEVPQLVGPGDVQLRRLLPSSLYQVAGFEVTAEQTALPWHQEPEAGAKPRPVVGEGAKRLGAKTPVRLVESAKSWLCHGGVNRTANILPWHAPDGVPKLSPVDAAAAFLGHLRDAWNHQMGPADPSRRLEAQEVVVTVPASFDEFARRLTLEAAKKAGLGEVTLLEEPLAAFYAFVARTGGTAQSTGLSGGEQVLIADVGGGTSDFTLVEVRAPKSPGAVLDFERTAVGDHLLLGGDNMDLGLAHTLEGELAKGKKLDAESWAQLKLECRLAKEALFEHPDRDAIPIVVTGRGTKLIGGAMRAQLDRATLERVVVDGYFPALQEGEAARPQRARHGAGFSEYGLPYAADPAVTRHLAAFLLRHAREGEPFARVDAILFNGGALKPASIRDRVSGVIGAWMRETAGGELRDPRPLIYDEGHDALELAVARGAAYFGLVRQGRGGRVGGGSPRADVLGVGLEEGRADPRADARADARAERGTVRVVCIAPRGMQDGQRVEVPDQEFNLVTNRPVEFPIFSTTSPRHDPVGAVIEVAEEELMKLPPLQTVVRFGKQKAGTRVPVRLQARRTELGTLELSCFSRMSGARFVLEFDLRASEGDGAEAPVTGASAAAEAPFGGAGVRPPPETGDVEPARLEAAKGRLEAPFALEPPRADPDLLMKGLEQDLGMGRDAFPLPVLRSLAEHLLELMERRALSPELEARWINITGFCLRPGMGVPMDDWRVRQLWKIHAQGVLFPSHAPAELNWWILWRRVAGGLARGHQEELAARVFPMIIPALAKRAKKKPPRTSSQEAAEMWRAAASLERISSRSRAQLGDALLLLLEEGKAPKGALWCLGRIAARKLLYGPREATVRPETAAAWAKRFIALKRPPKDEDPLACLVSLGRLTGDRQLDLPEEDRKALAGHLVGRGAQDAAVRPLLEIVQVDVAAQGAAFGEGLPVGLTLATDPS